MPARFTAFAIILLVYGSSSLAAELKPLRLGVLQFGTVNWELDVIKHHQLDHKHGIDLQITPLGGKNATHVAIQGGAVDVIVSDWIWVARQRHEGRKYSFSPYSRATGSLMVRPDSGIDSISDLDNRVIGIAGGPLDKSWLLMRAYTQKSLGKDLKTMIEPKFAAPPLLNQLALRNELDGVINFWHYAARLKARGFKQLFNLQQVLNGLGVERDIPMIGWVFNQQWAEQQSTTLSGLFKASAEAKQMLLQSDQEWVRIRPHMKAENDAIFDALKYEYRNGIPGCFNSADLKAAAKTFGILAEQGGTALTGGATKLDPDTFWQKSTSGECPQ